MSDARRPRALLLAAVLVVCIGCSGRGDPPRAVGSAVSVVESDFHIAAPAAEHVPAGEVRLTVENRGPETHELIVARASGSNLPLRADGVTVDEDALGSAIVGSLEGGAPGTVRQLQLRLVPGHYVMFCNMAGHYLAGMRTDVVVV